MPVSRGGRVARPAAWMVAVGLAVVASTSPPIAVWAVTTACSWLAFAGLAVHSLVSKPVTRLWSLVRVFAGFVAVWFFGVPVGSNWCVSKSREIGTQVLQESNERMVRQETELKHVVPMFGMGVHSVPWPRPCVSGGLDGYMLYRRRADSLCVSFREGDTIHEQCIAQQGELGSWRREEW